MTKVNILVNGVIQEVDEASLNIPNDPRSDPIPQTITRHQFFKQVWKMGIISFDEALNATKHNSVPAQFNTYIDVIPDPTLRSGAYLDVMGLGEFRRDALLTEAIRLANNWTSQQTDQLWKDASKL